MGKEKSEKSQFAKILELFEDFGEIAFLDFVRTEWAELALSNYRMFYMTYSDMNDYTSTPTSVVFSAPSLTPYDRYFPAYRIYTIDGNYPGSSFVCFSCFVFMTNLTQSI